MSKIKYVTPSGLAHYDEKIKEVIDKVDTSTNTKVTQTPTSTDASYPLLLSPSGQTQETNTTSYFNSGVVLNPSTKTISANIDGNAKTATSADSATKATKDASGNVITETYSKTNHTHNYAGSSSAGGVANSATKLATSRTVRTNLSSTSTASFDGSANIEPGVTGTLPVANGGTGKTTLGDSANALINGLSTSSDTPKDNDYYVSQYAGGGTTTTTFHRRPVSALWEYIKGKISSVLGLTASSYSGNSATATKLNTNDGSATQPTYFAGGIPKACTYSLNKTVPANAVFTDTDTKVTNTLATTTKAYVTGTTSASTNTGTQVFDTGVYLDTTSGQLTATTFKGSLNGNAETAKGVSNNCDFDFGSID